MARLTKRDIHKTWDKALGEQLVTITIESPLSDIVQTLREAADYFESSNPRCWDELRKAARLNSPNQEEED